MGFVADDPLLPMSGLANDVRQHVSLFVHLVLSDQASILLCLACLNTLLGIATFSTKLPLLQNSCRDNGQIMPNKTSNASSVLSGTSVAHSLAYLIFHKHLTFLRMVRGLMGARELLVACMLVTFMSGCSTSKTSDSNVSVFADVERFVGVLPCDECSMLRTDLTLKRDVNDGTPDGFVLHQTEVDAVAGNVSSTSWGQWRIEQKDEDIYYVMDHQPQDIVLRLSGDGTRLLWAGKRPQDHQNVSFILRPADPIR
ncbi:copper resistance protein NlpE N-terminal domain-containing protein [Halomonas cupida]|uniref:copper resistance protein NlpE N-terminal domain-containing protein n=1 Tax=Halomonas cupida TaxID=44933 RepID=UPI003EF32C40